MVLLKEHLKGRNINLFYDACDKDVKLIKKGKEYEKAKKKLVFRLGRKDS